MQQLKDRLATYPKAGIMPNSWHYVLLHIVMPICIGIACCIHTCTCICYLLAFGCETQYSKPFKLSVGIYPIHWFKAKNCTVKCSIHRFQGNVSQIHWNRSSTILGPILLDLLIKTLCYLCTFFLFGFEWIAMILVHSYFGLVICDSSMVRILAITAQCWDSYFLWYWFKSIVHIHLAWRRADHLFCTSSKIILGSWVWMCNFF